MVPASGKRSADSQLVLTQIGVRSASRSASIRTSGAPVFKPSSRASSRVATSSDESMSWARGSWPPAPTISENRVRERSG